MSVGMRIALMVLLFVVVIVCFVAPAWVLVSTVLDNTTRVRESGLPALRHLTSMEREAQATSRWVMYAGLSPVQAETNRALDSADAHADEYRGLLNELLAAGPAEALSAGDLEWATDLIEQEVHFFSECTFEWKQ